MKADDTTLARVRATLDRMAEAYRGRRLDTLIDCFVDDPDVSLIGTAADEQRFGRAAIRQQAERDWSQTEAIALETGSLAVSATGGVAWAFVDGAFRMRAGGGEQVLPARITYVLVEREGDWKIAHAHFSTPL